MDDWISKAEVLRMLDENGVVFRAEVEKMPTLNIYSNSLNDLISRAAAIKGLLSMCPEKTEPGSFDEYGVTVLCGAVDAVIKRLPAVDAAPVVHGRWNISMEHFTPDMICSVCDVRLPFIAGCCMEAKMKFCPNCGAKMDGERRDDDG